MILKFIKRQKRNARSRISVSATDFIHKFLENGLKNLKSFKNTTHLRGKPVKIYSFKRDTNT